MNKYACFIVSILTAVTANSQELDCQVVVNSNLVNQTNQQIFQTLERSLNEFMNTQKWTSSEFLNEEKITCSFVFMFTEYENDRFEGTLQIQSQRPVFESNYDSPILNFLDKDITFSYQEYQPLFYNPAVFESNLVGLMSFYAYLILGLDADSFKQESGTDYFKQAQQIVNLAQQSKIAGWNQNDGIKSRFALVDALLSNAYLEFRKTNYAYHRNGLDAMTTDTKKGKEEMAKSILRLEQLYDRRPDALLIQLFFDSKVDEIVNVFSGGPKITFDATKNTLDKIAPFFTSRWKQIKY